MTTNRKFSIKACTSADIAQAQHNQDVKRALDALLGNDKKALAKAITGQDLVTLGLVSAEDLQVLL